MGEKKKKKTEVDHKYGLTAAAKNVLSPISDSTVIASDLVKP